MRISRNSLVSITIMCFKNLFYDGNLRIYGQVERSTHCLLSKIINQFFSILFQECFDYMYQISLSKRKSCAFPLSLWLVTYLDVREKYVLNFLTLTQTIYILQFIFKDSKKRYELRNFGRVVAVLSKDTFLTDLFTLSTNFQLLYRNSMKIIQIRVKGMWNITDNYIEINKKPIKIF